jgi:hypothetical protein
MGILLRKQLGISVKEFAKVSGAHAAVNKPKFGSYFR